MSMYGTELYGGAILRCMDGLSRCDRYNMPFQCTVSVWMYRDKRVLKAAAAGLRTVRFVIREGFTMQSAREIGQNAWHAANCDHLFYAQLSQQLWETELLDVCLDACIAPHPSRFWSEIDKHNVVGGPYHIQSPPTALSILSATARVVAALKPTAYNGVSVRCTTE